MTRSAYLLMKYTYDLESLEENLDQKRKWLQSKMDMANYASDFNSIAQIAHECAELVAKIELVKTMVAELSKLIDKNDLQEA